MDTAALLENTAFLGEEFGTWLWYRCEGLDGEFDLGALGRISVMVADDLVLVGPDEDGGAAVITLRHGAPAYSAEAKAALSVGKKVKRIKLAIARGREEWTGVLDTQRFAFSALKLPPTDELLPTDAFIERMYTMQDAIDIIDTLLQDFLALRLSDLWADEVAAMQGWIERKQHR